MTNVQGTNNVIQVVFDQPMLQFGEGSAVTLVGNYQLDGRPLPAGTRIACYTPQCLIVQIELPQLMPAGTHTLRVVELVSQRGALLEPNPTVRQFQKG